MRSTGYYDGEMSWPEFQEGFKQKVCSVGPIKRTFNNYCAGAGPQYFQIDDTNYDGEMSWPEVKAGFKQKVCSVGPIASHFKTYCGGPQYFDIDDSDYGGHKGQLQKCVKTNGDYEVCEDDIRQGGICERDKSDWAMFVPESELPLLAQICDESDA